jgi:hypothetical protein
MRTTPTTAAIATFVCCLLVAACATAADPGGAPPSPLRGTVTSAEDGPMEGVVVSAQRRDSPITISVVSGARGEYRFPAGKIGPGLYSVRIRATGYDLDGPAEVEVGNGAQGARDIRLRKTADLAAQLTNAEWMASMPGLRRRSARSSTALPATRSSASCGRSTRPKNS